MFWIAFAPRPNASPLEGNENQPAKNGLRSASWWALRFTPRVSLQDEALLLEVQASERLFGGRRPLLERLRQEATEHDLAAMACAPTALGALALLRNVPLAPPPANSATKALIPVSACHQRQLPQRLSQLDLCALSAAIPHATTLRQLGCHTLGQLRALPRAGVSRRFGQALLDALDRAYGDRPDALCWITLPERFDESLDCPAPVEVGSGLLFGVQRLLQRLHHWLVARQAGLTALQLHWRHDTSRRHHLPDGQLPLHLSTPTRDMTHLARLLGEHLARTPLSAPVRSLRLEATGTAPLPGVSRSLWHDAREQGDSFNSMIERLSARLGTQRILRPVPQTDHRPECMTQWTDAISHRPKASPSWPAHTRLQPPWLLSTPVPLPTEKERPYYHGPLQLLAGPHRLETAWWPQAQSQSTTAQRDYYLAESPQVGRLWIYRDRLAGESTWYLHGIYG